MPFTWYVQRSPNLNAGISIHKTGTATISKALQEQQQLQPGMYLRLGFDAESGKIALEKHEQRVEGAAKLTSLKNRLLFACKGFMQANSIQPGRYKAADNQQGLIVCERMETPA